MSFQPGSTVYVASRIETEATHSVRAVYITQSSASIYQCFGLPLCFCSNLFSPSSSCQTPPSTTDLITLPLQAGSAPLLPYAHQSNIFLSNISYAINSMWPIIYVFCHWWRQNLYPQCHIPCFIFPCYLQMSLTRQQMAHSRTLPRRSLLSKCRKVSRYMNRPNAVSFTPITTVLPSQADFHETLKCYRALRADILYRISPKSYNKVWTRWIQIRWRV